MLKCRGEFCNKLNAGTYESLTLSFFLFFSLALSLSTSLPLHVDSSLLADYMGELEGLKDWRRLALKLGYSAKEVKKINENNKGQKEDCIMEVMDMWLQRGPSSTTAALIQALDGIQEHTIASRLHKGKDSYYIISK